MEEQTVWKGSSSQVINLGTYIVCGLLGLLVIPVLIFLWRGNSPNRGLFTLIALCFLLVPTAVALSKWIVNNCRVYEVTTQRIRVTKGVLSKRTDELELYRVRDTSLVEPFLFRLFGAGNIVLATMDTSNPELVLEAIKGAASVREDLRKSVEECRDRKGTRVAEFEGPQGTS